MQARVILNPYADRGRGQQCEEQIRAAAAPFGGLSIVQTRFPGHGRILAQEAVNDGYDLVVAAGGDGTISEVVNGLVLGDRAHARLGVIPIGTGNDLAWSLGISRDLPTAVARLFTGRSKLLDLGRVEDDHGRYHIFDNNLGIGFDARVVIETESITRLRGFAMYLLAVLRTIAFYYDTPRLDIQFDDQKISQEALFLAFGIGPRGGGGFLLTPDAKHNDNLIDTCLVSPVSRLTMLMMLLRVMRGKHGSHTAVTMRKNRQITIRADRPMPIHADGEVFAYPKDNIRQITVTSLPAAIEIML